VASHPAVAYGLAGLVPFVVLAGLPWLLPLQQAALAMFALLAYGAVILSFLGAVHWGLALAGAIPGSAAGRNAAGRGVRASWSRLGLAVLPALLAWVALLLPPALGLAALAAGFAFAWLVDRAAARAGLVPAWYLPLRSLLTLCVLLSLGVALAWFLRVASTQA
jgi:hypothetical protein